MQPSENEPGKGIIGILVMAEEKWWEADFLRSQIHAQGYKAIIIDIGLTGEPLGSCDIAREELIAASGRDIRDLELIKVREKRIPVMVEGGRSKVLELYSAGKLHGLISLGGTTGTQIGTGIMASLPFGVPKVAVCSTATVPGFAARFFGTSDIALVNSVVDFGGLNPLIRSVLARAAGAICGMVERSLALTLGISGKSTSVIAMTQFGGCEICAMTVRRLLEAKGYEVVCFSGSGGGDRAMEEMLQNQSLFSAVIELNPTGVGEELLGFSRAAGKRRLETAGERGLPQVIAPGGVNCGTPSKSRYKAEYGLRKQYIFDPLRTFIRLSEGEMIEVADNIAEKLNKARGPVKFLLPLGGWSSMDPRGAYLYDEKLDRVFAEELKKKLRKEIEIREVDTDLDTPEFAQEVMGAFEELISMMN